MIKIKSIWFKSAIILQSLIVLIASFGVSLSLHYCKGEMKSIGIYANAENCNMGTNLSTCDQTSSQKNEFSSSCCQNLQFYSHADLNASDLEKIDATTTNYTVLNTFSLIKKQTIVVPRIIDFDVCDSPPLVAVDFNILFDTFLI